MTEFRNTGSFDRRNDGRSRLGQLVRDIALGLETLHRVQFEQPWKAPTSGR